MLQMTRERPDVTLREARCMAMPSHHDVRPEDVDLKRLGAVLAVAYERELKSFRRSAAAGEPRPKDAADAGAGRRSRSRHAGTV